MLTIVWDLIRAMRDLACTGVHCDRIGWGFPRRSFARLLEMSNQCATKKSAWDYSDSCCARTSIPYRNISVSGLRAAFYVCYAMKAYTCDRLRRKSHKNQTDLHKSGIEAQDWRSELATARFDHVIRKHNKSAHVQILPDCCTKRSWDWWSPNSLLREMWFAQCPWVAFTCRWTWSSSFQRRAAFLFLKEWYLQDVPVRHQACHRLCGRRDGVQGESDHWRSNRADEWVQGGCAGVSCFV